MDRNFTPYKHIRSILTRAKWVLAWERLWPHLFSVLLVILGFLALSWLGFFALLPVWGKVTVALVFACLIGMCGLNILRISWPDHTDAIQQVEANSAGNHRPLTTTLDRLPEKDAAASPMQQRLWQVHQERAQAQLSNLKAGYPAPQVEKRDPYALRTVVVLLAVIGFFVAGSDRSLRLFDLFTFSNAKAVQSTRLDAWVTPPSYTDRPPIFLTKDTEYAPTDVISVPQGSVVTIRLVQQEAGTVVFSQEGGEPVAIAADSDGSSRDQAGIEPKAYEHTLAESGSITVDLAGNDKSWSFDVIKDQKPSIAFATEPTIQRSGAIEVVSILKDDYGVVRADSEFKPTAKADSSLNADDARPLYEQPQFSLHLNRGRVKDGTSKTIRSIVNHPWAGADVLMTLRAFDQSGQMGVSDPIEFTLPSRRFSKPVARALIEQRRNLALDANYAPRLANVLDALTVRPEQFKDDYGLLIALSAVERSTRDARDDDDLRRVVDQLWDIAIGLEEGDLSDAERNLRDALEALREGIENGVSEEELARLMNEARQAMREFMQALAEQAQRNAEAQNQSPQNQQQFDPSQALTPQDLERMLDRIEELAETGSRDAAQQLLSELQQMMENLQANNGQENSRGDSRAQQMLNELGEMIRRQQQLLDQTFRQQNQQNRQGYQGQQQQRQQGGEQQQGQSQQNGEPQGQQQGQSLEQLLEQLQNGQQGLADRLQEFLQSMQQNGQGENRQLGDAQQSMGDAARQLGEGNLPRAGENQGEALNNLRRGARELANQMAGEGSGEGDHDLAQGDRRRDPLGRQERTEGSDFGDEVKVPDEIDTQRAREILDIIRRRLGESLRPTIELEYLERLLKSE